MTFCCVSKLSHTTFKIIFITNYRQQVVIGFNIGLLLKLLFCSLVTTINNLTLRICYEIVVDITFIYIKKIYKSVELNFFFIGMNLTYDICPTTVIALGKQIDSIRRLK